MEAILQLVERVGPTVAVLLLILWNMFKKTEGETKPITAMTEIALDSTEGLEKRSDQLLAQSNQMVEVIRQLGDVREAFGQAKGENAELRRNFESSENKREEMRNKIIELDNSSKIQQATISRHEGRIAQLETENTNQAKLIVLKETRIVELETENAKHRVKIEEQDRKLTEQEHEIQLMTRAQRFGDTVPLSESKLNQLDSSEAPETIAASTPETNEEERKIA